MHISKWGNSLAIRLPAPLSETLGLKAGDHVEVTVTPSHELDMAHTATRAELAAGLGAYRHRLPADFKFDREEANAR
jgi:antitoxin MazE